MSDCGSSAMEPRTCGTCKHVRDVWLDCFFAENDNSYYMRCTKPNVMACEHYVDDPDSPQRRYERLAQVAREMYELIERWEIERDDDRERLDGPSPCRGMIATAIKRQLESLGVSVDD